MESSEAKGAGQLIGTLASGELLACLKLARLERDWEKAAGRVVSERTQLQSCSFTPQGLHIVVNVADSGTLSSLRFRKAALEGKVASYLSARSVQIEFRIGRLDKKSSAKGPLPEHKRRAPVVLSEEAVKRQMEELDCEKNDDITEALARLKAVTEKLRSRRRP